ncbi:sulfhydryl oxidase [Chelonus insularis]|nr:sulfhydryl oxidase [Chelonus insularis]
MDTEDPNVDSIIEDVDENGNTVVQSFKLSDVWDFIRNKFNKEQASKEEEYNYYSDQSIITNNFHFNQTVSECNYKINYIAFKRVRYYFDEHLNNFLAYLRAYEPNIDLEASFILGTFLRTLFKLIILVTHYDNSAMIKIDGLDELNNVTICHSMMYDACRELFGISEKLEKIKLERNDWSLDKWGRAYWNFLHSLSILVQYTNQKYPERLVMEYYAALMLNFDVILPCAVCADNYQKKNPLMSVSLPIIYSKDAIKVTYDLHNSVRINNGNDIYDFRDFLNDWHLEADEVKVKDIRSIYKFEVEK